MKSMISKCVDCSKLCGKTCQQNMSDLPEEWLIEEPPFNYCGVDMFGSFLVKECQKIQMLWGNVHMLVQSCCSYRENKQYDN